MTHAVIAATGLFTPEQSVSNAELVDSYNAWADGWNARHAAQMSGDPVKLGKVAPGDGGVVKLGMV